MHKVAVYAICKNEERFVDRALFSVSNADYIIVMDTGSTDNTLNKLNELKTMLPQLQIYEKEINPWRFDVARNECLKFIPKDADILVSIDMDEIFPNNWKEMIEEDFDKGYNKITVNKQDFDENGRVAAIFQYTRITGSKLHWEGAIHEEPILDEEERPYIDQRFTIMHKPDKAKNRDYLSIMEDNLDTSKEEDMFRYGWELLNKGQWDQGINVFKSLYNPNSIYTVRKWLVTIGDWLVTQQRYTEAKEWYQHAYSVHQEQSQWEDTMLYPDSVIDERIKKAEVVNHYKIAVYAICGNEVDNVDPWMESMWEADYICILDTGSTDGSYEKLLDWAKKYPNKVIVAQKTYKPWRFDIPRNDSMKLVPQDADLCICTDLAERLTKTWGDKVRAAWHPGCERGYYLYAWSHLQNGDPARVFWYDKIHANSGKWQWKFPVHEASWHPDYEHVNLAQNQVCSMPADFIMLHHYPKHKDGRSNYLPLLEMRAEEYKDDFYGLIYLAHEYKYQGKFKECINFVNQRVFPLMLNQPDNMNCKTDLYMFLGDCYLELDNVVEAEACYRAGIAMDPTFRDNYLRLAKIKLNQSKNEETIEIINEAFLKSRHQYSWLECDTCWSWEPWDMLCMAYWNIQAIDMSYQCALIAYQMDPQNDRLKYNVQQLASMLKR